MSVTVVDKIVGNLIECAHGDGVSTAFMPDIIAPLPTANTTYYKTDWQGTYRLYPTSRTNKCLRSTAIQSSPWSSAASGTGSAVSVTGNSDAAPDGTQTACRVQANRGAGNTGADFSIWNQVISGHDGVSAYTISIWLRSNTGVNQGAMLGAGGIGLYKITVTPEWKRFTFTGVATAGSSFQFGSYGPAGGTNSLDILAWGAQDEIGSVATSFIPTAASAVAVTDYTISSGLVTLATPLSAGQALYRRLFNEYGIVL